MSRDHSHLTLFPTCLNLHTAWNNTPKMPKMTRKMTVKVVCYLHAVLWDQVELLVLILVAFCTWEILFSIKYVKLGFSDQNSFRKHLCFPLEEIPLIHLSVLKSNNTGCKATLAVSPQSQAHQILGVGWNTIQFCHDTKVPILIISRLWIITFLQVFYKNQ